MRTRWPSRLTLAGIPGHTLLAAGGLALAIHVGGLAVLLVAGVGRHAQLTDAAAGPDRIVTFLEVEPPPAPQPNSEPDAPQPAEPAPPPPPPEPLAVNPAPAPVEPAPRPAAPTTPHAPAPRSPAPPSVTVRPREAPRDDSISFAGVKAKRAQRIVYVVDASGPMVTYWRWVSTQVALSLARLGPGQQFQVVAVRTPPPADDQPDAPREPEILCPAAGLLAAGPAATDDAKAWLADLRPRGASDFLPGLAAALRLQPDLVLLLAQGYQRAGGSTLARDPADLLARLDQLNPKGVGGKRRVVIKTVQFLEDDPTGILRAIAESHGDGPGSYHIVTLREIRQSAEPQGNR